MIIFIEYLYLNLKWLYLVQWIKLINEKFLLYLTFFKKNERNQFHSKTIEKNLDGILYYMLNRAEYEKRLEEDPDILESMTEDYEYTMEY